MWVCAWSVIRITRRWNALQLRMCVCEWWVLCCNFADVAKTMIMMAALLKQTYVATQRGAQGSGGKLKLSVLIAAVLFKVLLLWFFFCFLSWLTAKYNLINVSQFRWGAAKYLQEPAMGATECTVKCVWKLICLKFSG